MRFLSVDFSDLLNKTITKIDGLEVHSKDVFFHVDDKIYHMHHQQECCETVYVEDVCGDVNDLIGSPILMAEESMTKGEGDSDGIESSITWSFYKLATIKGYVTIRWYGESNGYYSESVEFEKYNTTEGK